MLFTENPRVGGSIPPLPLEAGENEVLIVVTEGFSGWGLQAHSSRISAASGSMGPARPHAKTLNQCWILLRFFV